MKVLIVEDDLKLSEALVDILKNNDYMVDAVYNGSDGFYYASNYDYDAIILDVLMPKMNGYEVIRMLRQHKISTPTLMLTAKSEIDDKVTGLDSGADDYMVKPFSPKELLARLRAVSRRIGDVAVDKISFGDIELDLNTSAISCGTKTISISSTEFKIIYIFMKNPKTIISKDKLITKVWGYDSETTDNKIGVYLTYLRRKLIYIKSRVSIKSIRMMGYILEDNTHD